MAKHLIKGYITFNGSRYTADEHRVGFSTYKPSADISPDTVVVQEHEFEVEVPDGFDPRTRMVKNLEEQKKRVQAEFARAVRDIDRRIQSLLAIEHTA